MISYLQSAGTYVASAASSASSNLKAAGASLSEKVQAVFKKKPIIESPELKALKARQTELEVTIKKCYNASFDLTLSKAERNTARTDKNAAEIELEEVKNNIIAASNPNKPHEIAINNDIVSLKAVKKQLENKVKSLGDKHPELEKTLAQLKQINITIEKCEFAILLAQAKAT